MKQIFKKPQNVIFVIESTLTKTYVSEIIVISQENTEGSAHQECNLKLKIKRDNIKIPVIFHNLRGYDSHFIMQQIGEIAKEHTYTNKRGEECYMNINCIPNNMEKYMAFMLGNHLIFLDSFQFMSSSLDNLIKNLPDEAFKYTYNKFKQEQFDLMKQKGIYPYDHMDSFEKFKQTITNERAILQHIK